MSLKLFWLTISMQVVSLYGSVSWALGYWVQPSCPKGAISKTTEIIGETPKDIRLDCEHDQGRTPTCGFHATTALLTALYKQEQKEKLKPDERVEGNFHVLDLIEKLGGTLESRADIASTLWRVKRNLKSLAKNTNGRGLKVYHDVNRTVGSCYGNYSSLFIRDTSKDLDKIK